MDIKIPSRATLKKYGLTPQYWEQLLRSQKGVCAICKKVPTSGRFYIDHYHHPRFKKMSDEEKRACLRGLLCYMCNRFYVAKGITVEKAKNVVTYLEEFEKRKPQ